MGLTFNGASQWLQAAWAPGGSMQPMTFMAWIRRADLYQEDSVICAGDIDASLAFNNLQCWDDRTRAISFNAYAEARSNTVIPINTVTFLAGVFDGTALRVYVGSDAVVSQAWSPGTSAIDQLRIGASVSSDALSYMDGVIEHAAVWRTALSDANITALRTLASAPTDFANLIAWLPLKSNITDLVGTLTWTAQGSPSTYVDLGIEYGGGTTYAVSYNANGGTGAPTDANSPYDENDTVTVLGAGSMVRPGYTFAGWNTAANGSGTARAPSSTFSMPAAAVTLYAQWTRGARVINHDNFDPTSLSLAAIQAAAALKVHFQHASTGQDVAGDSVTNSSTGNNYDDSALCGLALLYATNSRYLCDRDTNADGDDYTWYATHNGLQTNNRGNPTPATKLSQFTGLSANMRAAVDVAMFKYCWIDVWPETTGYISDGAAAAASDMSALATFRSNNPDITVVVWTMPLQSDASYAARQAYNDAVRAYCVTNNVWLMDMADIECHNDAGVKQLDGNSREVATAAYVIADGGHLSAAGRTKMGQAYWSLLAGIAGEVSYQLAGVTRNASGAVLGGCQVSLFKHTGSGVYQYLDTQVSNATTGAYSFETADGDAAYFITTRKTGSPNVFACSDSNLTPAVV